MSNKRLRETNDTTEQGLIGLNRKSIDSKVIGDSEKSHGQSIVFAFHWVPETDDADGRDVSRSAFS